jgi:ABC-type transporter Mla subunit MlaD
MTTIHLHFHFPPAAPDVEHLFDHLEDIIMATQAELLASLQTVTTALQGVGAQLTKATDEIIVALSNAGAVSPEIDAAVAGLTAVADALKAASQTLDDLNPDAPAPVV